ncbi:hypothetical protein JOD54_002031 [Actinokineospora baliensis]|nr:hypothetical protein [Actinokineospora baliensis]
MTRRELRRSAGVGGAALSAPASRAQAAAPLWTDWV